MRAIDCHTRRNAIHVTIALIIGTLAIAGIAEEIKKRKAVDSYLRHLDSRIERVETITSDEAGELVLSGGFHQVRYRGPAPI